MIFSISNFRKLNFNFFFFFFNPFIHNEMSLIVNMKIVLMICVFYHVWVGGGGGGLSSGARCQVFVLFLNLLSYLVSVSSECADRLCNNDEKK